MKNRYYTLMVIPEKSSDVKKWILPNWVVRGAVVVAVFAVALVFMMLVDYWYVMNQIDQNRSLRIQNQKLQQEVNMVEKKVESLESTLERLKTFATRLKVITNIGARDKMVLNLKNTPLPNADENIGGFLRQKPPTARAEPTPPHSTEGSPETQSIPLSSLDQNFFDAFETERELVVLREVLANEKDFLHTLPQIRPANGIITSGFGLRKNGPRKRPKIHEGIDIANRAGTQIIATADGEVTYSGMKTGYGRTVIVRHGNDLETWYAHSQKLLVRAGQKVEKGQKIALMGNTGRTSGTHLHYEVRHKGIPVDPLDYFLEFPQF